jgi:hypothetical protein
MADTNKGTTNANVAEKAKKDPKVQAKIDAYKAKVKKLQEARKAARGRIVTFLNENADQLGALKADIELFIGKGGARVGVPGANFELRDALIAAGAKGMSELDIFKKYHVGRNEMKVKIRIFLLTPNPVDRVWVTFDEASETYKVVGAGEKAPAGWTGYDPSAKKKGL